jgi:hypothetical protein
VEVSYDVPLAIYHLIGRTDDLVHFQTSKQRGHNQWDFALKRTKVWWSKNVMEERRCPNQILFGAMEPLYCVMINLGVYLEMYLELFPQAKYLYTDNDDGNAPANLIAQYRGRIEVVVWDSNEFEAVVDDEDEEGIGTHSYRKYPSNYAVNCGCSADEVEIRGRWKQRGGRVVFRYIDVKQLYHYAKVTAVLCVGGPVEYKLKEGLDATITSEWLWQHVIPKIWQKYPNDIHLCRVLVLAVLFACLDDNAAVPEGF